MDKKTLASKTEKAKAEIHKMPLNELLGYIHRGFLLTQSTIFPRSDIAKTGMALVRIQIDELSRRYEKLENAAKEHENGRLL
jgi:hypothetical protein